MKRCAMAAVGCLLAAGAARAAEVTPPDGAVVPTLTAAQKAYFAKPRDERKALFENRARRLDLARAGDRPAVTAFAWPDGTPPYVFRLARARDGAAVACVTTDVARAALDNLEIARRYDWRVTDAAGRECARASFRTEDAAPRLLRIGGVSNARDLGGRLGWGGRRVRQGRIVRTAQYNDHTCWADATDAAGAVTGVVWRTGATRIDADGLFFMTNTLAVRLDLDLRADDECRNLAGSPLGPGVVRRHIPFVMYAEIQNPHGRAAFADIFRLCLDERNLPLAFHCIYGKDRTGAVAFVLNALLGVAEEDLYKDWEATGFCDTVIGFNHADRFDKLVRSFDRWPGATLNARVEAWVLSLGFSADDLARFRAQMLENAE